MAYTVVKAESAEDLRRIEAFIDEHFMKDMPLFRAFDLENVSPDPPSPPDNNEGKFRLMAVNAQGDIVGVAVSKVNVEFQIDKDEKPEWRKVWELLKWVEKDARLDTLPEKTIELRVLAVHREWRGRGIARALAEESVKRARESGYQTMRVCCTSEYTARLARSMGWRQHYRLLYADYPSRSGTDVVVMPEPPHDSIYYYVTDL